MAAAITIDYHEERVSWQELEAFLPDGHAELPLRERKKAETRARILACASRLFGQHGYDTTSMELIATTVGVSSPTVFNYFPSKQYILLELQFEDRRQQVRVCEALIAKSEGDPIEDLVQLFRSDFACAERVEDRALWREILAANVRVRHSHSNDFARNAVMFEDCLRAVLLHHIRRGTLAAHLDVELVVRILYAVTWDNLRALVTTDDATIEDVLATSRAQIEVVLLSWLVPREPQRDQGN